MITDITRALISKCILEFSKKENREQLNKELLNPMTDYIYDRMYIAFFPCVCYSIAIAMTIIVLLISILVILLRKGN